MIGEIHKGWLVGCDMHAQMQADAIHLKRRRHATITGKATFAISKVKFKPD